VEGSDPAAAIPFLTAEGTDLAFTPPEQQGQLTIARVFVEQGNLVDNIAQESRGSVESLTIPAAYAAAGGGPTPADIGYENIVVDVTWDGSRDVEAGTMTVDDFTVSIQDGGDLSITGVMGKLPDPRVINDADAAAEASKMELHNLYVRYDDNSLASRILDQLAQQQGLSRTDYATQMAAALPFLLAALNNPQFQEQVATALGAFLQDPQSLSISVEPETPVTGEEIMNIVGTAPQTLPDRLNATVTANTPE
jgi:hypothetical protein